MLGRHHRHRQGPAPLLLRLCAAVPAPRFHTVRYAGVLASAAKLRPKIIPKTAADDEPPASDEEPKKKGCGYWPWAELMSRTFELDVSRCPRCEGRLVLVALVKDERSASRFAKSLGEPTEAPARSPPRPPPYFRSPVIRRLTGHDLAVA